MSVKNTLFLVKNLSYIIVSLLFLTGLAVFFSLPFIQALYYEKHNVSVIIKDCDSSCEIKGTLKNNPFRDQFYIVNESKVTYFNYDAFEKMTIPYEKTIPFSLQNIVVSDLYYRAKTAYENKDKEQASSPTISDNSPSTQEKELLTTDIEINKYCLSLEKNIEESIEEYTRNSRSFRYAEDNASNVRVPDQYKSLCHDFYVKVKLRSNDKYQLPVKTGNFIVFETAGKMVNPCEMEDIKFQKINHSGFWLMRINYLNNSVQLLFGDETLYKKALTDFSELDISNYKNCRSQKKSFKTPLLFEQINEE